MADLKDLFVIFDIAKQIKEHGFKDRCFGYFLVRNSLIIETADFGKGLLLCPTYQQVIDWLREEHNIHIELAIDWTDKENQLSQKNYSYCLNIKNDDKNTGVWNYFNTYYEAVNAAIEQALKLI